MDNIGDSLSWVLERKRIESVVGVGNYLVVVIHQIPQKFYHYGIKQLERVMSERASNHLQHGL